MPLLEAALAWSEIDLEPNSRRKPAGPPARILCVSPVPEDYKDLRGIVSDSMWRIAAADSCQDAIAYLTRTEVSIVFCEHTLPDGSWRQLLDHATLLPIPPPVIVTSRLADDHLWAEVLNLGGFDVLAKPYNAREVRHVLASAWVQRVRPLGNVGMAAGNA